MPRILALLLHAHLPYGGRCGEPDSLESAWLYEAMTHCYLPLLTLLERLEKKDAPWLTLSLSPTLLELWAHPDFKQNYRNHLEKGIQIIAGEAQRRGEPEVKRALAQHILSDWIAAQSTFESLSGAMAEAFVREYQAGKIELITTTATHAFLPAFQNDRSYRIFQIQNGLETFQRHTSIHPKGFWLPECGYFRGLEEDLALFGIEYFGLEAEGLTQAEPPVSIRRPLACPNGILGLGRDRSLSQKVWSARSGYPGHPDYREFHHDGIHQMDTSDAQSFDLSAGERRPFGLKYWRVTGQPEKDWYKPERAREQAQSDALDFIQTLTNGPVGLAFLPFDAELFGHWWYEGPVWLEKVLRLAADSPEILLQSASSASRSAQPAVQGHPAASSWGRKSDYSFWVNRDTDWIYPLLNGCSKELRRHIHEHGLPQANSVSERALCQAARELLLAGASDWPFMLRAGTTDRYAIEQVRLHIKAFHFLLHQIKTCSLQEEDLNLMEKLHPAFSSVSLKSYLNEA